jgi:hypothetical protein
MTVTVVPTLSTFGWVTSVPEKIDFLLTHFFVSDKYQSTLYKGNISNAQAIIQQYGNNITGITNALRDTLGSYLSRYFSNVNISVGYTDADPVNSSTKVEVQIGILFTENGVEYSAQKQIPLIDGRFANFQSLNNLQTADS